MNSDIMLQGFKWDAKVEREPYKWYKHLSEKANDIKDSKIDMVWFPPPSKSRVQEWVGYTPMDYYDLGNHKQWVQEWNGKKFIWREHDGIETLYGTKDDLINTIKLFNSNGIKCLADIVINHRAYQQVNFFSEKVCWAGPEHKIASNKLLWGDWSNRPNGADFWKNDRPEEITFLHGGSSQDDGDKDFGSNIAHSNPKAKNDIKEWLKWLRDEIGFEGWRYDYVKGFAAYHIGEYNDASNPYISIGEYWDNVDSIVKWIDKTHQEPMKRSMAFDFPLKWHLNEVFWGRKPFNDLGLWKYDKKSSLTACWPSKSVTFLDNHDTTKEAGKEFPKDDKRLIQGHVFLLTHPGIPCIYWSHFYERNQMVHDAIKNLCRFRKEESICNKSKIEILVYTKSCYVARIDNKILVKIGEDFWNPGHIDGNWSRVHDLTGDGYAVWKRT